MNSATAGSIPKKSVRICVLVAVSGLIVAVIAMLLGIVPGVVGLKEYREPELLEIARRYSKDFYGRKFDERSFSGRTTLLLFMSQQRESDLLLFYKIYAEWIAEGLNLIVVSDDPESTFFPSPALFDGLWIFPDKSRNLADTFRTSSKNPTFILYNEQGDRLTVADNDIGYEQGARIHIVKALGLRPPLREAFAPLGRDIESLEWLTDMKSSLINTDGLGSIVVFINSYCETCNGGTIMEKLRRFTLSGAPFEIKPLFVLSSDFSPQDCVNLEDRYKHGFPIIIASKVLAEKWRMLHKDYFHGELNNIMVLISKGGKILGAADAECACYQELFMRAEELMISRNLK